MSDSESVGGSSVTTIESLPFETIISNIKESVAETIESEDYLSYSTILDIYLSDPSKYTTDERETLLQTVLDVLNENPKLTYEIGWDLPSLLIAFFESDFKFDTALRHSPCSVRVFYIFNCLAKLGNHKELFLKCCELLSTVKLEDIDVSSDDDSVRERFLYLKLYSLYELINTNLKNIETLYPSRFLSMCISSFLNSIYISLDRTRDMEFYFKRIYSFVRNYNAMPLPKDHGLSKEELQKVIADEEYLQRKLLQGFVSNAIFLIGRHWIPSSAHNYIGSIVNRPTEDSTLLVIDRLYELCMSFDMDLDKVFTDIIVSTHEIFHKFDLTINEDDVLSEMFEKLVVDYQENLFTNIINKDLKEIEISKLGCLLYHARSVAFDTKKNHFPVNLSFTDAVMLTLRLIVPMLVSPNFNNNSVKDLVVFWSWYAIEKSTFEKKNLTLEVSAIPKVYLTTYCSMLLFICSSCPSSDLKDFRFDTLTLVSKVLASAPEQTSYTIILDSLRNCPLENMKAALIGVLKELFTKDKATDDDLESDLKSLALDSDERTSNPPALPSRDVKKSTKYLTLTENRFLDVLDLIDTTIESSFIEVENDQDSETETETDDVKYYRINSGPLNTLSAELNLLVILKSYDAFKAHQNRVDSIISNFNKILSTAKSQFKGSSNELNVFEMLSITVDRITI
ncbi:hypothetical protein PSN45_004379 [Yamadazyma tenuis]|uniref:YAP1 binding protein 2 n=1 Tax=Candida tenuis (strain ATCC 10573 / BCRC 21748 / CBS 615 / JCM 9827 / NBRC 10315 / NRRL Y-1498 / VKM Y-70) TaxID=590646 RepID=G3B5Z8_CANTC|nr:YAP1 binding protein 2 [Yamadazyma tenuis ATCC 10573]EGV63342.1 YAP1 binding protein 2 [Yamadazyma tenuis ATCC 10573]WEJ96835.1 hypothetical protein PSN45_004379 [Yamadazyma tenuis]